MSTNGSDNHLLLINLRNKKISGSLVEKLCEYVDISINKNSVYGDTSALNPGGIRIGTQAVTTRGYQEDDIKKVGEFLIKAIDLSLKIQSILVKLSDFINICQTNDDIKNEIKNLKLQINDFSSKFEFYEISI